MKGGMGKKRDRIKKEKNKKKEKQHPWSYRGQRRVCEAGTDTARTSGAQKGKPEKSRDK